MRMLFSSRRSLNGRMRSSSLGPFKIEDWECRTFSSCLNFYVLISLKSSFKYSKNRGALSGEELFKSPLGPSENSRILKAKIFLAPPERQVKRITDIVHLIGCRLVSRRS